MWHGVKTDYIPHGRKLRLHHATLIKDPDSDIQETCGYQRSRGRECPIYVYMYIHTFFSHAKHAHSMREAGGNGITGVKGVQDIEEQIEREIIFSSFFFFLISFRFSCAFGFNQDNGIGRVNGWMVVRSCFGRRSVAVGGPRWSLPSSLAFPEHPSRRADRAVPSGPILLSRLGVLRAVHKMRHDAYERNVGSFARTHARERAARNFRGRLSFRALSAVWRIAWSIFTEAYLRTRRHRENATLQPFFWRYYARETLRRIITRGWLKR